MNSTSDDPNRPVVLARYGSEAEAVAVLTALTAEGIDAMTTGGHTASFIAEAPGDVAVNVRACDLERAQNVLETFNTED